MTIDECFNRIIEYGHVYNWCDDLRLLKEIYNKFPDSYTVLMPFAYSYLEELIRSMTSNYGRVPVDKEGNAQNHIVGYKLLQLALKENRNNKALVKLLKRDSIIKYFDKSTPYDRGNNRNSTVHAYLHPIFWTKESFEALIRDIADLSEFSGF